MTIKAHHNAGINIAEVTSPEQFINTADDALDLLGNLSYQGYDKIIVHERHLTPDFFDLKNGLAGEILQKFSTYRMGLAIVGDVSRHTGTAIRSFIIESNRAGHINFSDSTEEAVQQLSRR